ncbi:MAG: 1-acyl-sn-glycerol-3-phosphate acyltransferase, partial [Nocardioidaceae bacterium]
MPDAEIIPLGTRGRPGRGSGSNKPSAAARNLAGGAKKPAQQSAPTAASATPDDRTEARDRGAGARPAGEPDEGETPPVGAGAVPPGPEPDETAAKTSERPRSGTTAEDRAPGAGIPVSDWLQAFSVAAKEVFGDRWEPRLAEFLAFLRRRVTGDYAVDAYGFDAELTERFFLAAVRPIAEKWFRVEVRGIDNIPTGGGALVVSNHSGTVPMDGLVTAVSIHDRTGRHLRPLGADLVFRMPVIGELARKGGATLACNDDAERMLRGGELVGVWPEGFKGIGKPYSERYKLQRFGRGGFVSAAMRTGVPIVGEMARKGGATLA